MALAESPPNAPLVASERINTCLLLKCSFIRRRSPRIAPLCLGELGSTLITPILCAVFFSITCIRLFTSVLLPAPGGPVMPITGMYFSCFRLSKICSYPGISFSTRVIALARAFLSPCIKSVIIFSISLSMSKQR